MKIELYAGGPVTTEHTWDKMGRKFKVILCFCPGELVEIGNVPVFNESP